MAEALLTLREAAKFLAVNPETLRRWATTGRVSYIRINTRLKFKPSVVATYINKREVAA